MAITAAAARAKSEVEARFTIALNRPRSFHEIRRKVLEACQRPGFADAAIYRKPIGSGTVDGFSIRFAEECLKTMGNIAVDAPVIWDDDERRTVRITVTDLESNTSYSKDINLSKTVERRNVKAGQNVLGERKNSIGQTVYLVEASEDEIAVKVAAAESKVVRNAALRLMPSDVLDEAWDVVNKTQKDRGSDPQAEQKRIVDAFATLNVGPTELERYMKHPLAIVSKKELTELRAIYTSIKEGEASWADYVAPQTETEAAASVPKARLGRPPKNPAPAPAPAATKTDDGDLGPQTATPLAQVAPPKKAPPVQPTPAERLVMLRAKMVESGVSEQEFVECLCELGIMDSSITLDQAVELAPSAISASLNGWNSVLKAITEARG